MIVRPEGKGVLRVFDPLMYPDFKWAPDCILNITVFLEQNAMRRVANGEKQLTNNDREYYHLLKSVDIFDKLNPSQRKDISMELLITVNGHLTDDRSIDYLKSIDDTLICNQKIHITVHQRPNIGWQWGALYDIWQKWGSLNTPWWITKEVDWHFQLPMWFDVLREKYYERQETNICFVSGHQRKFKFNPYNYDGPLSKETWRDKYGAPLKNATFKDVYHVQPSYYFMPKNFLEHMDKRYGCFTYAIDKNYELDAIVYGEIGFCQKAKALGYEWIEFDEICYNEDY